MSRPWHPGSVLAALAGLGACGGDAQPPDVVLIVVDTLRADRLSAYGYPRPTAPFLEQLAREGTLFEDATTQFSWTMPSMVSLFTGHYLTEFMPVVPSDAPTLAECFQRAGYTTLAVVSNMLVEPTAGFARGFDHYDVRPSPDPEVSHQLWRTAAEIRADLRPELERVLAPDAHGRRKPVFLYVHTFDPHHPYQAHDDLAQALPVTATLPVEPAGWQESVLAERGPPATDGDWTEELAFLHEERGRYDQEVRYTDEELRRLSGELAELGLLDNAVVAFVADHGEGLWEHVRPEMATQPLAEAPPPQFFYQSHGQVQYQEVLHTPFILWGAGVPRDVRVRAAVENVDLAPTLLELADVPALSALHGRSLVELMHGRAGPWREHVFSNATRFTSVREIATGLKLVIPQPIARALGHSEQLFDLRADPHERVDLAADRPQDVARLKQVHAEWKRRFPTPNYLEKSVREDDAARRAVLLRELGYAGSETGIGEPRSGR
jgi:arylsulfatase A-like enzyme